MVQGLFLVDLADTRREYFVDLRKTNPDETANLFEPWGPVQWTRE